MARFNPVAGSVSGGGGHVTGREEECPLSCSPAACTSEVGYGSGGRPGRGPAGCPSYHHGLWDTESLGPGEAVPIFLSRNFSARPHNWPVEGLSTWG